MKAYLNIICISELKKRSRNEIEIFLRCFDAELISISENVYWKEERCIQLSAEIALYDVAIEKIAEEIKNIWATKDEVHYNVDEGYAELSVYASMLDVLLGNKVFLTFSFANVCGECK